MRCRLCGGPAEEITDYDLARVQPHWRRFDHPTRVVIARCLDHGSLFTVSPPPPAILLTQYQYDHAAYCGSATGGSTGRTTRCLEGLRRWLPPGTRILDLGGGDGAFAIQAARAGYESWMLETGAPPLGLLEREGVRFVRELGALAPGTFDAVTLWNVLEHAWPVEGLLAPIRKVLRPGECCSERFRRSPGLPACASSDGSSRTARAGPRRSAS